MPNGNDPTPQSDSGQGEGGSGTGQGEGAGNQTSQKALEAAAAELGFKSVDEWVKSTKESHATITRLSQRQAELIREKEEAEAAAVAASRMGQNAGSGGMMTNYGDAQELDAGAIQAMVKQEIWAQRTNDLVGQEPPEKQARLRQLMVEEVAASPHLQFTADPIKGYYERAKVKMDQEGNALVQQMFGPDVTVEMIRERVLGKAGDRDGQGKDDPTKSQRLNAGFVPDGPGGGHASEADQAENWQRQRDEAMARGDAEAIAEFVFRDPSKIMKGKA
jgi:hypothetical protein